MFAYYVFYTLATWKNNY